MDRDRPCRNQPRTLGVISDVSLEDAPDGPVDKLQAAVALAEGYGWRVLPVDPSERKAPLLSNGVKGASSHIKTIRSWRRMWHDGANIGVACGADYDGPTVLDVDAPEHVPPKVAELVANHTGPVAFTARGRHLYFAGNDGPNIGALRNEEGQKYGELRNSGYYVVAPPSIHHTGVVYTWNPSPAEAALTEAPAF